MGEKDNGSSVVVVEDKDVPNSVEVVEDPPAASAGGTPIDINPDTGRPTTTEAQPGAPASQAGPLEHKKAQGDTMSDPDGHCKACGHDMGGDTWQHSDCGFSVDKWNDNIDEFVQNSRDAGMTDKEIQDKWDSTVGQWRQQGLQQDFLDMLEQKGIDNTGQSAR